MIIHDVPEENWIDFLDSFSRQHDGWISQVGIRAAQGPPVYEVREMPFAGVSADAKGPGRGAIAVVLRQDDSTSVTRIVSQPRAIRFRQTEDGAHEGLEIIAADGAATLIKFRTPAKPEMLNGLAEGEGRASHGRNF